MRLALAGLALGGATWAVSTGGGGSAHPDRWDPRVAPLVAFVEDHRGLRFDHPVAVDFLEANAYSDLVREEDTHERRVDLERAGRVQRALGLVQGDVDLSGALNKVADDGTLAFYDPLERRIRARGSQLTPALRVTLVHELTHALADQALDLGRIDADIDDEGAATGLRALAEGDAIALEDEYIDGLDDPERDRYLQETAQVSSSADQQLDEVPDVVTAIFSAPYDLGTPLVAALLGVGGWRLVNQAYGSPPASEVELFDPAGYVERLIAGSDAAEPLEVEPGAERGDEDDVEDGTLGVVTWYLLLVERIDPSLALAAVDGWAGDRYVVTDDGGTTCVRAVFAGATRRDDSEMSRALAEWARAMPGARSEAERFASRPGLRSCDPGPGADLALTGRAGRGMAVPALRATLQAQAIGAAGPDVARCFGQAVVDEFDFEALSDPSGALFDDPELERAADSAARSCS